MRYYPYFFFRGGAQAQAHRRRQGAQVQANLRMPSEAELNMMVSAHPDMLYIPPGPFVMGRLNSEDLANASQSEPLARVMKTDGYFVDRFEFPNRTVDKEGNRVLFSSYAGTEVKYEGEEYLIMREEDILAIIG